MDTYILVFGRQCGGCRRATSWGRRPGGPRDGPLESYSVFYLLLEFLAVVGFMPVFG